jgi:diguanylate cyclase (GGDEF)-like protein
MIYLIFVLTLAGMFILLQSRINRGRNLIQNDLAEVEEAFSDLEIKEKQIEEENSKREKGVVRIANLYEATREISEFLEEDKIFSNFKNCLGKFIKFEDCSYMAKIETDKDLNNLEVMPLVSENNSYGYLAINGLAKEERPILDILVAQLTASLKRSRLYEKVQELAITDSLTSVFTRRYAFDRFEEELRRSEEFNLPLSFLMIDIDNFKSYNDKYGHMVGDVILKTTADIIKLNCREIDLIGRFGGEEFMVILPMTSKDGAIFAAERIRKSLENKKIRAFDELLTVTVSIGVASYPQDSNSGQDLIDKADWALYRSKQTGRNKVSAFAKYQ